MISLVTDLRDDALLDLPENFSKNFRRTYGKKKVDA